MDQTERAIGRHGIIGDLATTCLVADDGTIDFLCWPTIDGPSVFASLLDRERGGEFQVRPALADARTVQLYVPGTNVLVTRWLSTAGSAEVTDFMPFPDDGIRGPMIVRRLRATRGDVRFDVDCSPRLDYAREIPDLSVEGEAVAFRGRDRTLRLVGACGWRAEGGTAAGTITLKEGGDAFLILADAAAAPVDLAAASQLLDRTLAAWRAWTARSTYKGRWRETVERSALALKLLASREHGSIAAAATFGLPEHVGGVRNWDYRATWIRDASFTVYAFIRLGHLEEAEAFRRWIFDRARASHDMKIMYALDGGEVGSETDLDHLRGHLGSRPVRIGNDARDQAQLDIFGEAMDCVYLVNKYGAAISHEQWQGIRRTVDYVGARWRDADAGIWEKRGEPRHHLHSRLMCWVAVDRAVRLAQKRSLSAPLHAWTQLRNEISDSIWSEFRHPDSGHFVSESGGREVDAAMLMMPLVRFVSATDPVWLATLDAVERELGDDGMIWRYRGEDGLPGREGAFTTCMFWYVECLARAGRIDEAAVEFEKCLAYANHLGLYSEELDLRGRQLGNFPQALTHLALISAAFFLDRRLDGATTREWQP